MTSKGKRIRFERAKNPFKISKIRIAKGTLIGLTYAFSFYAFLYIVREAFRVMSKTDDFDLWILSDNEVNFYNLFFAALAVIFGVSVGFQYLFDKPRKMFEKQHYRITSINNDLRVQSWIVTGVFGKFALAFGIMFGVAFRGGFYAISLYPQYNYLFVLIIIALFLQMWNTIRLSFKRHSLKWMISALIIMSTLAFGLSKINIIDYHKLNQNYLQQNAFYKYHLELPESDIHQRINKHSLSIKIHFVKNLDSTIDKPIILVDNYPIELKHVGVYLVTFKNCRREEEKPFVISHIYIDKDIEMQHVNKLIKELRKVNMLKVAFAVVPKNRKYNVQFYRNLVFKMKLHPLDDASMIKETIKIANSFSNIIEIKQNNSGQTFINNELIADAQIKEHLQKLMEQKPDYIIKYEINDEVHFADYLKIHIVLRKIINEFRELYAQRTYGKSFYSLSREERRKVRDKYPTRIIDITSEMKALIK